MIRPILAAACAAFLWGAPAAAAVFAVPADHATIQQAIDAAGPGDTVHVAAGVYEERLEIRDKGDFALIGAGADETIVDAGEAGRCLYLRNVDGTTLIRGLQFTRGAVQDVDGDGAGALVENSRPVFESCSFIGNDASNEGGGANLKQCTSFEIRDCTFEANKAVAAAALTVLGGRGEVSGSRFLRNDGALTVNLSFTGTRFDDNLVAHNACSDFGAIGYLVSLSGSIRNNTIAHNFGKAGSGAIIAQSGDNEISGNIIAFNRDLFAMQVQTYDQLIRIHDNVLFENDGGDYTGDYGKPADTQADPMFCDPANDDFRLEAGSPCLADGSVVAGALGAGCD